MNSTLDLPVTSNAAGDVAKILIVEDSITFQALHRGYLSDAGYPAVCVSSGEEALQTLELERFDIILMDVTMPGLDGYETAQLIREQYAERWIPIIFIAGHEEDEHFHKAIESGGDDYLIKPVREVALISKVKAVCRILKMQDGLKAAQKEFEHRSRTDVLTGLLSRRALLDEAETQWQLLTRLRHPVAVLLIDIDFFKLYNDHYGHHGGDECLVNVADVLGKAFSRDTDLVGRLGGEEFLVVLPNTSTVHATELAKRLQRRLANEDYEHIKSPLKRVTISIGCAACHSLKDYDFESLVQHADDLLYEAKRSGRDTVAWDDFPTSQQLLDEAIDIPALNEVVSEPNALKKTFPRYLWIGAIVACVVLMGISWKMITTHDPVSASSPSVVPAVTKPAVNVNAANMTEPLQAETAVKDDLVEESERLLAEGRAILDESRALLAISQPESALETNLETTPEHSAGTVAQIKETTGTDQTRSDMAVAVPETVADEAALVEPAADIIQVPTPEEKVANAVNSWMSAWQSQHEAIFDYYHADFRSAAGTPFNQWKPLRWQRITKPKFIEVELENMSINADGDYYVATFEQQYRSDTLADFGLKTLVFKKDTAQDMWLIVSETFSAL